MPQISNPKQTSMSFESVPDDDIPTHRHIVVNPLNNQSLVHEELITNGSIQQSGFLLSPSTHSKYHTPNHQQQYLKAQQFTDTADYKQVHSAHNILHYYCSDSIPCLHAVNMNTIQTPNITNNSSFKPLDQNILSSLIKCASIDDITSTYNNWDNSSKSSNDMNNIAIASHKSPVMTPNNNKKKKRKKTRRNKKRITTSRCYEPISVHRAQGIIQISKTMTEQIIPQIIKEDITNLYCYMDKSVALCHVDNIFIDGKIKIIDYDFHDKKTGEKLYCIAEQQDKSKNNARGYQWRMINRLFTENDIYNEYKNAVINVPQSNRNSVEYMNELNYGDKIRCILKDIQIRHKIVDVTRWCKMDIFHRVNNKKRMTLSVTKPEFIKTCNNFMNNANDIKLIPILMFNGDGQRYYIEHLWIVRVSDDDEGIDVGIAFRYDSERDTVIVNGIHLDKEYIRAQHELAVPQHSVDCNCLDSFASNIDALAIGNPDDNLNKIKYYKQQIEELQKQLTDKSEKLEAVQQQYENKRNNIKLDHAVQINTNYTNYTTPYVPCDYYNNNNNGLDSFQMVQNVKNTYYNASQTPTSLAIE